MISSSSLYRAAESPSLTGKKLLSRLIQELILRQVVSTKRSHILQGGHSYKVSGYFRVMSYCQHRRTGHQSQHLPLCCIWRRAQWHGDSELTYLLSRLQLDSCIDVGVCTESARLAVATTESVPTRAASRTAKKALVRTPQQARWSSIASKRGVRAT